VAQSGLTLDRRFFPSTEPTATENEDDWEDVKEGESAENGAPEVEVTEEAESKPEDAEETPNIELSQLPDVTQETAEDTPDVELSQLPDVPKDDLADEGPSPKKQKPNTKDAREE
jgi:hypothetical protein